MGGSTCLLGVAIAAWYGFAWMRGRVEMEGASTPRGQDRPWRRLGAAICGFVGIVSFAGMLLLDWRSTPRLYMLFWVIVLLLVTWLCGLALTDILHTRNLLRIERARRRARLAAMIQGAIREQN